MKHHAQPADQVNFNVSLKFDVNELSQLNPQQIKAVFDGMAKVLAADKNPAVAQSLMQCEQLVSERRRDLERKETTQ